MIDMQFKIFRFDPQSDAEPHYRRYEVQAEPWERLLDCVNRIKWEQDGTLSYRMSCAHGVCGSDAMKINGRCALACQKLVKDYQDTEVVLEPLPTFRVLKDLVVDLDPFLRELTSSGRISSTRERLTEKGFSRRRTETKWTRLSGAYCAHAAWARVPSRMRIRTSSDPRLLCKHSGAHSIPGISSRPSGSGNWITPTARGAVSTTSNAPVSAQKRFLSPNPSI